MPNQFDAFIVDNFVQLWINIRLQIIHFEVDLLKILNLLKQHLKHILDQCVKAPFRGIYQYKRRL